MKQYKVGRYIVLAAIGFVALSAGIVLLLFCPELDGTLKAVPYLCVGIGAGFFGGNLGTAIKNRTIQRNPVAAKQVEIEQNDERNQAINHKAKAKAYDIMIYSFAAVLLAFVFMQVDAYIILTLVAIYLVFIISYVVYFTKYNKEM